MDHREQLEQLNKQALDRFYEYAKTKEKLGQEHQEKLHNAKDEWQEAWIKLREVLMVLERLEI